MSRQGLSSSTQLAQPNKTTQPVQHMSKEDELEFLTQSLIKNLNNPPVSPNSVILMNFICT